MALRTHHSIIDAWSLQILLADLGAAYHSALDRQQPNLSDLSIQYSDFAAWQHSQLETGGWQGHIDYWKTQLAGANEVLDLPATRPRPETSSGEGYFVPMSVDADLLRKLQSVATDAKASPLMLLTAVFQVGSLLLTPPAQPRVWQALLRVFMSMFPSLFIDLYGCCLAIANGSFHQFEV